MNIESFIKKHSTQSAILLITISFITLLYNDFINTSFWYDEAYTSAMIKYSFPQIWDITAMDVHPPLYYFMLKAFTLIIDDYRYTLRIFSALGVLSSFVLALYPVKRLFGKEVSFTFILLLAIMPVTQYLGVEIRMYSWAMFFVLGCSVYAYESYKTIRLASFAKMTLMGVCAAYTHYYALVAVGIIYFLLWISMLKKHEGVVRLTLFTVIFIIAYSPWIPELFFQISGNGDSWIKVPNAKEMLLFCYYFFSPKEPSHPYLIFSLPVMSVALSLMLILIAVIIYFVIKAHTDKWPSKRILTGDGFVGVALLTLFVTFAITFLVKPISIPRYTTCILGPLLLGIAIYLVELYKNKARRAIIVVSLSLLFILSVARFFSEKAYYEIKSAELVEISRFFERGARKPDIVLANLSSYPVLAQMQIMFPDRRSILNSPGDQVNYLPFRINVVDSIPNIPAFFFVQFADDSASIDNRYTIKDQLQLDEYGIFLLENKINE